MAVDSGVANARTELAWQRTAVSLLAGSAFLSRVTLDQLGALALVSVAVATPLALWVLFEGRGRYRHDADIARRPQPRGGRAPLTLTVATLAIGCTQLAALMLS